MTNTVAIIILYNPNIEQLTKNLLVLCPQVSSCILVDNSVPETTNIPPLGNIHHILLNENVGIAEAQNIGLKQAIASNAKFAILFDQDSDISDGFVDSLTSTFLLEEALTNNLIAVGPRPFDIFTQQKITPSVQKENSNNSQLTICSQIIASGKTIMLSKLNDVGFFESSLFIDGVDHEWCWRAKAKGYTVGINEEVVMEHQLGESRGQFFGVTYKIGAPIRLYYQFRNILILSRRSYVPCYWKLRNLISIPVRFAIFTIKGPDRRKRLKFMIKGISHGFIRNTSNQ